MAIFIIGIFSIVFVLDFILNGLLLQWGTLNSEELFLNQQWWRVITAPFFHGSIIHILANSLAIYFTGALIESKIGSNWFLLVFMISNILERIIFAHVFHPFSSIGSSPGIFGLMAIILIYCLRNKDFFVKHKRSKAMNFLIGYGIAGNVVFVVNFADFIGRFFVHAVGFVIGIVLGMIVIPILSLVSKDKTSKDNSV